MPTRQPARSPERFLPKGFPLNSAQNMSLIRSGIRARAKHALQWAGQDLNL
jgi:hypothetical protein